MGSVPLLEGRQHLCSGESVFGAGVEVAALCSVWCWLSYRLLGQAFELLLGVMD